MRFVGGDLQPERLNPPGNRTTQRHRPWGKSMALQLGIACGLLTVSLHGIGLPPANAQQSPTAQKSPTVQQSPAQRAPTDDSEAAPAAGGEQADESVPPNGGQGLPTAPRGPQDDPHIVPLDGLTRLSPDHEIWIDVKKRRVVVGGKVCLTQGFLEMFACPRGTKEHESIVSLNAKAFQIHAALLAIGSKPGQPVRYQPDYRPASGPVISVEVQWKDAEGRPQSAPAQQWIRHAEKKSPMEYDWVFAGSGFWKDTSTGKEHYLAEGGEVICVSNFGTALLDLPIKSSQDNADLMFEAFTDHIPPRDTPVRIILSEKEPADADKKPTATQPAGKQPTDK